MRTWELKSNANYTTAFFYIIMLVMFVVLTYFTLINFLWLGVAFFFPFLLYFSFKLYTMPTLIICEGILRYKKKFLNKEWVYDVSQIKGYNTFKSITEYKFYNGIIFQMNDNTIFEVDALQISNVGELESFFSSKIPLDDALQHNRSADFLLFFYILLFILIIAITS